MYLSLSLSEFKSLVHTNRTGFRASLTWSKCRWAVKWQTYIWTTFAELFLEIFFVFQKLNQITSLKVSSAFFFVHVMLHVNYISNGWDGCTSVHLKQLYSLHKHAIKLLMPTRDMDYIQVLCSQTTSVRQTTVTNKCVLMQKVVHGILHNTWKISWFLLNDSWKYKKQKTFCLGRLMFFGTSLSFSGSCMEQFASLS